VTRGQIALAVVGCGYWGEKHVRVFGGMPDVSLTVVDTDPSRLAAARNAHPSVRLATSIEEVLPLVDAVVVATPSATHSRLALAAIRAGRHVFVEKPLATTVADCQELVDAADARGVLLMTGHTFEHNAAVWKLREFVVSGHLGEIRYVDCARLSLGLYQPDVNVIWDLAPHDVSIVNFLLGRLPSAVSAWGYGHANLGLEDVAHLQLRYTEPDIRAYIHVSWLAPCKVRRVTVVGSHKMAVYNDMSVDDRIRVYDTGLEDRFADSVDATPVAYRRGDIVSPFVPFVEPLSVQDAHLIDCIRTGSPPRTDGNSGLAVARVLEAANSALISGREVAIHTLPMLTDAEVVHAPDLTRYDTERPLVLDGDTA
jgi:predicted dehydrogenase